MCIVMCALKDAGARRGSGPSQTSASASRPSASQMGLHHWQLSMKTAASAA